jgi:ABC-2 type transport system ATP-binding protein
MESVIEITALCKRYKTFSLEDVTLTVPKGYVTGLVGPNGAGKTTLIKAIMNLRRIDAGRIEVFGRDHATDEVAIKRRIGFVYDTPFIGPDMSMHTLVPVFRSAYPTWDDARFEELCRTLDVPRRTQMRQLSHGAQMKCCIAFALAHRADLLILDEPTQGLDPVIRREFLQLLRGAVEEQGASVLLSTHITSDLESIADHVVLLHRGRVLLALGMEELRENWGLVRLAMKPREEARPDCVRGERPHAYGCELLVSDRAAARAAYGADCVIDDASIEDVLYFLTRDGHA